MNNDSLQTEEFAKKKDHKIIFFLVILIIILIISFVTYKYISLNKNKKIKKNENEITTLNEELQNIYGFALSNNYIVALKKDGTTINIYNLLQGTGNLGDFTNYFYYNDKLYLLYSDNILYTISLNSGNKVYELTKYFDISKINCLNQELGMTNDISFYNNTIYLNNSNCSVTRNKIDSKTKKITSDTLKIFNNKNISIEYSKNNNSLFVNADNSILKFDNKTGEITSIATDTATSIPLKLKENILIYSKNINNVKTFYGYNVITNDNGKIIDADDLILYKNKFIYLKDNAIYMLDGENTNKIYEAHYNNLSNLQLINNDKLQIVDTDSNDYNKKRIVNIDLKSKKYDTLIVNKEFTNIVEYQ